MSIKSILKESRTFVYYYYLINYFLFSNKRYTLNRFKKQMGKKLDLVNPRTFNEKLCWMIVYWENDLAKRCADKFLVREYVKEIGLGSLLNEVYQLVSSVDEIDFEKLPKSFVIKSTQGSGMNYFCKDKKYLDYNDLKRKTKYYTKTNYHYYKGREWVYKDIKPKIIVEKFLGEDTVPKDYKLYCFNGVPHCIQVDINRFKNDHRENFYDVDWNFIDVMDIDCPSDSSLIEPKPVLLEKMIEYSKKLSSGFPHVRVDFYILGDRLFFGELTFFTACGTTRFSDINFDLKLGNLITLPKSKERP